MLNLEAFKVDEEMAEIKSSTHFHETRNKKRRCLAK